MHDDSLSSDDEKIDDTVDHEALLQKCIQDGINTSTTRLIGMPPLNAHNRLPTAPKFPLLVVKENPIGMLRKGGNAYIETNTDEMNRFQIEDSPCNFSIASGLSDLTVGSNRAGLLKTNR